MIAVEARGYAPPTRITVKNFLLDEWLPAVKGTLRPTTYASYTMLAQQHINPWPGSAIGVGIASAGQRLGLRRAARIAA